MIQEYFKFIEDGYDGQREIIFPMKPNKKAYQILQAYFNPLYETSYYVKRMEVVSHLSDKPDYEKLGLNKNIRVCNGIIDTYRLQKWLLALENGDDYFQDLGLLSICAYFPTDFL